MKRFYSLLFLWLVSLLLAEYASAQSFPYQKKWEHIERQELAGKLKSLKPEVEEIYQQSKKEQQAAHRIKALLYLLKIDMTTEGGPQREQELYRRFTKEIETAAGVERSILQSHLAQALDEYYWHNLHRIRQRTPIHADTMITDDLAVWGQAEYERVTEGLYQASLESDGLKEEPADRWELLLDTVVRNRELRPTMFDILVHRASAYYLGRDRETAKKLLTDLAAFHLGEGRITPYLYNQLLISRQFREKSDPDVRIASLRSLSSVHSDNRYTGEVLNELARLYRQKMQALDREALELRKRYADSIVNFADTVHQKFPGSFADFSLQRMRAQIVDPGINVRTDSYVLPDQPFHAFISHKNLHSVYVRVTKAKRSYPFGIDGFPPGGYLLTQQVIDSFFRANEPLQAYEIRLKHHDDYEERSTIVALNPLPVGFYRISVSDNEQFRADSGVVSAHYISVSRHALAFRHDELLLTDRQTGEPLPGKEISVYTVDEKSGLQSGNNQGLQLLQQVITDGYGIASLVNNKNESLRQSPRLFFRVGDEPVEILNVAHRQSAASANQTDTSRALHFFTDRAVYRPGQTLHFKGILYHQAPGYRYVQSSYPVKVYLVDPNNKRIDTLELTTNSYGSVSGKFVLPAGRMTGRYYLQSDETGRKEFRVEEYKRPGFEVRMDTVSDRYRLGQDIVRTGKAVSFSGGSMDKAKVAYRVVRHQVYPYAWGNFRSNIPPAEIAAGETVTDSNGIFHIPFTAIPGEKATAGEFRFYRYHLSVIVTDRSGESQTGIDRMLLGDKSVLLDLQVPASISLPELDSIAITTTDLNGRRVAAKGNLQLIKLEEGERVLRNQVFNKVDYMEQDSSAFVKLFPGLPYMNDHLPENRPKQRTVFSREFDTGLQQAVSLKGIRRAVPGTYIVEAWVVDGNDTLRLSRHVVLSDPARRKPGKSTFLEVSTVKKMYPRGEYPEVLLSSALRNAKVLVEVEDGGDRVYKEWIELNNTQKKWRVPVAASSDKELRVHYYLGKYNSVKTGAVVIAVQQPEQGLTVSTRTFRSSVQPGQEESWELLVKGAGDKRAAAEVVAGMYDAALDKFGVNNFRLAIAPSMPQNRMEGWNPFNAIGTMNVSSQTLRRPIPAFSYEKPEDLERFGFTLTLSYQGAQATYLSRLKQRGRAVETRVGLYDFQDIAEVVVTGFGSSNRATVVGASNMEVGNDVRHVINGIAYPVMPLGLGDTEAQLQQVKARTDLRETAFFFPDLKTDDEGNVSVSFRAPERLTQWKFMALAHSKEMQTGYLELPVQTRKELMVQPHVPRFVREGDEVEITAKVSNLSAAPLSGNVKLSLLDPHTMQPVDSLYNLSAGLQAFQVSESGSTTARWQFRVPEGKHTMLVYRMAAAAADFSDGEEAMLPVLPRRIPVTETRPIQVPEGQSRSFILKPLAEAGTDSRHIRLSLDVSSHPLWQVLPALPYVKDYPYTSSDQLVNRLYSAGITHAVMETMPEVKAFFTAERQRGGEKDIQTSKELTNMIMEETPWLREADNETDRARALAQLTKPENLQQLWQETLQELRAHQFPSGGFPWFSGGPVNEVVSIQVVAGLGRLLQLPVDVTELGDAKVYQVIERRVVEYVDGQAKTALQRSTAGSNWSAQGWIHYLYARSYFLEDYPLHSGFQDSVFTRLHLLSKDRITASLQHRAMEATVYQRYGQSARAMQLIAALKEYAVTDKETGMHWRENTSGWCWWQHPIETQALLIEAFSEVSGNASDIQQMQWWLLRNKQGAYWPGTRATIAAVQALLFGTDGKVAPVPVAAPTVKVGGQAVTGASQSAFPGAVQHSWKPEEITPAMARVEITNTGSAPVRGALHWQRLEDISQVQSAASGVSIEKTLFLKTTEGGKPVLQPLKAEQPVKTGDLLTVRLVIRTDRDMDFVHLKDVRPGGAEPVNVLSSYKWQGGLSYYESTRDAATHFFIDRMQEGTYVFEYDLRAAHAGRFTTGIATLQSLYLPDMAARGVYQGELLVD